VGRSLLDFCCTSFYFKADLYFLCWSFGSACCFCLLPLNPCQATLDLELQYNIAQHYQTVRLFASSADDRGSLRLMAPDFSLDLTAAGAAGVINRARMAKLISAWECSRDFTSKEQELRAEAKILNVPRSLGTTDKAAMKRAVENVYGKLPARLTPDGDYLSAKIEEVEQDEIKASSLDDITSAHDGQAHSFQSSVDPSGRIRISKTKAKGKMPLNSEELRMRFRLEGNAWCMIAAKFKYKTFLMDMAPKCWEDYVDYLLGERVFRMEIPKLGEDGTVPLDPPWQIILSYDFALRREAFARVRDDSTGVLTLAKALLEVCRDPELKELHFTSPLALCGTAHKRAQPGPKAEKADDHRVKNVRKDHNKKKGGGKGKGGGKAKGVKGSGKGNLVGSTPDGKRICFDFNNATGCTRADCSFLHVCRVRGCFSAAHSADLHI
jgi:hypothetical protein